MVWKDELINPSGLSSICNCPRQVPLTVIVPRISFYFILFLPLFLLPTSQRSTRMSTSIVDLDLDDGRTCALVFDVGNSPFKELLNIQELARREAGAIYLRNCESARVCACARGHHAGIDPKRVERDPAFSVPIRTC